MKAVVILGTFNPVTKAHIMIGELARETIGANIVIYVPSNTDYMKSWKHYDDENIMRSDNRYQMLEKCIQMTPFIHTELKFVDNCEIEHVVSGKTYDTLAYLCKKYGIRFEDLYLVMGTDKLDDFCDWYKAEDIIRKYNIFLIKRNNEDIKTKMSKNILFSAYQNHVITNDGFAELQDISSSKIRENLKRLKKEGHCA